jgi:hypothetical protein
MKIPCIGHKPIKSPCVDCITLIMCKNRVQAFANQYNTDDLGYFVIMCLSECPMLREYLHSHPGHYFENESSYLTEVINIMGLRDEKPM